MKKYIGTCYIGTVGSEEENGLCRDSINRIILRSGDSPPLPYRGTKGQDTREEHFNNWLNNTRHDFMLLLDADMDFEPDTLERLRSHHLPYVSGFYMRRMYNPVAPVWYKQGPKGVFPMEPWLDAPKRGKLHKLGASGWGCILVHREVAEAVRGYLKGERFVIEDDMDLYPYDLKKIMSYIALIEKDPGAAKNALLSEIRPLRVKKDIIGSDIRFPFYAREVGYTLWGDPDVRPRHNLNYPLSPDDMPEDGDGPPEWKTGTKRAVREGRKEIQAIKESLWS